jgi:hypothetical protein
VATGLGPFEQLAVTGGVAGGEDRWPADLGLDVFDLGAALVGAADRVDGAAHEGLAAGVAIGSTA